MDPNYPLDVLKDILGGVKYILAGLAIFFTGWFFVRKYMDETLNFKAREFRKASLAHTLPLRLQAYERITLFLERLNPSNMLLRLYVPGMSAAEMQNMILSDIRSEYQHNITQQIYVSTTAWAVVKKIKEDTITMVNSAVNALPENASAADLNKSILIHLAKLETENPYDVALNIVKRDIQQLF
ncbi:MAG: hypothetical protein WBP45_01990 [Daejeonella sp.]